MPPIQWVKLRQKSRLLGITSHCAGKWSLWW